MALNQNHYKRADSRRCMASSRKPTVKELAAMQQASTTRIEHLEKAVGELQHIIQSLYQAIHGDVTRYEMMLELLCGFTGVEYIGPPQPEEEGNIEVSEEE
jgi:hypothetical protein